MWYDPPVAEKKQSGRVPDLVGSLPVVGSLAKTADLQAQWMQDMVEQQARLLGALPDALRNLNDSIERFNQNVQRLDRTITRIESATGTIVAPMEKIASAVDPANIPDLPDLFDLLRKETIPALRAATDTQRQMALLQSTVDRIAALLNDLPAVRLMKRMTGQGER